MQSHRDWFAERFRGSRLIAIGASRAGWRRWRPHTLVRSLRQSTFAVAAAISTLCTAVGTVLAVTPNTVVSASLSSRNYQLGDTILHSSDGITYTGAAVLVVHHVGAGTRGATAATIGGRHFVGVCDVQGGSGTCTFTIGGAVVRSHDRYSGGHWTRQYDDGHTVVIDAAADVPVPFPIGR